MTAHTNNIAKSEQIVRKHGKVTMLGGLAMLIGGVVWTVISMQGDSDNGTIRIGAIVVGLILFARGAAQYWWGDKSAEIAANKKLYGVEEPDATWQCPKCQSENPNTSYTCPGCGYKVV